MNAEKFTQKTIETINTAQAMAQENGNQYLTPAHLLYALIDQDGGLIGSLLGKMGADCDGMLGELDAEIRKLPASPAETARSTPRPRPPSSSALPKRPRKSSGTSTSPLSI